MANRMLSRSVFKGVNEISRDMIRTAKYEVSIRKIQEVKLKFYAKELEYLYVLWYYVVAVKGNVVLESFVHVSYGHVSC